MSEKLKPCPFCGQIEPVEITEKYHSGSYYVVTCNYLKGGCGTAGGNRTGYSEAVKAWNTRPGSEDVEQLESRLDMAVELLQRTAVKINPVTCFHRHGSEIPKNRLDELSNWQLEIEKFLKENYK